MSGDIYSFLELPAPASAGTSSLVFDTPTLDKMSEVSISSDRLFSLAIIWDADRSAVSKVSDLLLVYSTVTVGRPDNLTCVVIWHSGFVLWAAVILAKKSLALRQSLDQGENRTAILIIRARDMSTLRMEFTCSKLL